ncbi:MAG: type II toxin-antitoxin system prevent-host-death family antitoxin [Acidobacteria bacterium]|nr:type II toxin-antitoxin system prevent-host-death family antitoxin [Acidobacteriota bacterium]
MRLGLREANQRFSKAIRAVRAGEEVVLTERGRPIAVIKPFTRKDAPAAALQAMVEAGLVTPATRGGPMPPPRWRPVKVTGRSLSQSIIDDRDDRL